MIVRKGVTRIKQFTNEPDIHAPQIFPRSDADELAAMIAALPNGFRFHSFPPSLRQKFLDFMTGKKSLPLTYDSFFKKLMDPYLHPERLSSFISNIIGQPVTIVEVLNPVENLLPGDSLLVMDIIVRLADGALTNVEIQKIPYMFPAQRISCYSSDLLLRQYSDVKRRMNAAFSYKDLKKTYMIVIFESSVKEFRLPSLNGAYIHVGKTVFDTGLQMELLQEYYLISLDVFTDPRYPRDNSELNVWLSFLTSTDVDRLEYLSTLYPWVKEMCEDMASYIQKPEEVLSMFSDALRELDSNTVKYMIEQQRDELEQNAIQLEQNAIQLEQNAIQLERNTIQLKQNAIQLEQNAIELVHMSTEKSVNRSLKTRSLLT